jgi:hypothetical protein
MPRTYRIAALRRLGALLSLLTLGGLGLTPNNAHASRPVWLPVASDLTSIAAAPGGGFWVQLDHYAPYANSTPPRGETVVVDGAPYFGQATDRGSIAAIPGRNGYWIVAPKGPILNFGDAPPLCDGDLSNCSDFPGIPSNSEIIVGAAATPTGQGLWAVSRNGTLWTAGDAQPYGDVQNDPQVVTGIAATPSGKGYYIVMEDGGVFSFGDAVFFGSTGGKRPGGHDVTGIALSIGEDGNVNGYWLTAVDGGVFTFGQAPFWGSAGINPTKVTSIVSFPAHVPGQTPQRTRGYALVHEGGNVGVHNRP